MISAVQSGRVVRKASVRRPSLALIASAAATIVASLGGPALADTLSWDPAISGNTTPGGAGTWDTTTNRWFNTTGPGAQEAWKSVLTTADLAQFDGTGGIVVIDTAAAGVGVGGMTFNGTGYVINGASATDNITLNGSPAITVAGTGIATVNAGLVGSVGVTKSGTGTLAIGGTNTFTGVLTVSAGTLRLDSASGLGASGSTNFTVVAAGATVDLNGQTTAETFGPAATPFADAFGGATAVLTNSSATAAAVTGTINFDGGGTFTVDGVGDISLTRVTRANGSSGEPTIIKEGSNTLTLGGGSDNAATAVTVNSGVVLLAKSSSSTVHALGGATTINTGGTLRLAGTGGDQIFNSSNVAVTGGVFDLNGRSETINALTGTATGSVTNNATNTPSTLTVGSNSGSGVFDGVISDGAGTSTIGLTKIGTGTQTLTNNNTYSGATAVTRGNFTLDFAAAGGTNDNLLSASTALTLGNSDNNRTLLFTLTGDASVTNNQTFNGVNISSANRHQIVLTSGTGGTMNVNLGALSNSGNGTLDFVLPTSGAISTSNADGPLGTRITLNNGSSYARIAGGFITAFNGDLVYVTGVDISDLPGYTAASHLRVDATSTGNVLQSAGTTQLDAISLVDAADRTVTVGSGNTLHLGASGGILRSSGAGSAAIGAIGNAGEVTAGAAAGASLILTNGETDGGLLINSVVKNNAGGAISLVSNGPGTTTLSGANTFTGGITVQNGSLRLAHNTASGTTAGGIIVSTGAALELAGDISIGDEAISLLGTGVGSNGALRNVSGSNTYGGLVTVTGTAELQADTGTTLTFDRTGTATAVTTASSLTLDTPGTGTIVFNDALVTTGSSNPAITKSGPGTLIFNASNTFVGTGTLTVGGGVLRMSHGGGLGGTSAGTSISGNASLELTGGITTNEPITLNNTTGISGGGAIRSVGGANILSGTVSLSNGTGRIAADAGTSLTLSNATTAIQTQSNSSRTIIFSGAGDITVAGGGAKNNGTGLLSITKEGAGTLHLNSTGTASGTLTITNGTVVANATNSFMGASNLNGGTLVVAKTDALAVASTISISTANAGGIGTLRLATDTSVLAYPITGSSTNPGTIISDRATAGAGITHTLGAGNLGNNTYSFAAGSNVTSGTAGIALASINLGAGGAGTTVLNPTTADLTITGGVSIASNNHAKTLNLGGESTGNAVNGAITNGLNTLTLIKSNISTWTLAGANTYTGATTVNGGVLNLSGSSSASAITVNAAGTFNVTGTGALTGTTALTNLGTSSLLGANTHIGSTNINGGTLTLGGSISASPVNVGPAGTLNIAGTGALTGTATLATSGTTTLSGSVAGATTVTGGTLTLNYDTGAGGTNSSKLGDAAVVTLGGGSVVLSGGSHLETVASTTLNAGTTTVISRSSGTSVLALGAVTPGAGAVINLLGNNIASTTNGNASSGHLGGWATVTIGGSTEFATNSGVSDGGTGSLITAFAPTYTDITRLGPSVVPNLASTDVRIINGGTSGNITLEDTPLTAISTLRMDASDGAATIEPAAATDVFMIGGESGGGIIQTPTSGGLTIGATANRGVLTTGGAANAGSVTLALANDSLTNDLTINSVIANNGTDVVGVAKSGGGRVVLGGTNTFTGGVAINGGTLFIGAPTDASTTATLGAGTVITNNGVLTFRRTDAAAVDLAGAISGSGPVVYEGTGVTGQSQYTINNASTYSGGTTISSARGGASNSTGFGTGTVTVTSGGQAWLNTGSAFANNFVISGSGWTEGAGQLGAIRMINSTSISGTVTLAGDARIATSNSGTGTINGVVSGDFNLQIGGGSTSSGTTEGNGAVRLNGNNTYTGTTTVLGTSNTTNWPNLIVGHANALGTTTAGTTVNGSAATSSFGSRLQLAAGITVTGETLTLSSAAGQRASLYFNSSASSATWAGNIVLSGAGSNGFFADTNATSILNVGVLGATTVTSTGSDLSVRGGTATGNLYSTVSLGTGRLLKTDSGTWVIHAADNDYTGNTTISAGTLSFANIANSGSPSSIGAGSSILLGQNSAGAGGVGTMRFTGAAGGSSNRSISIVNGATGGAATIENTAAGQLLALVGNVSTTTPASASTLTITGAGDGELGGNITGAPLLSLSKTGGGTWTTSGVNTQTGPTTVDAGTLVVSGTLAAASSSTTVHAGTLRGTGTIAGPLTIGNTGATVDAIVSPGDSIGTMTVGGNVTVNNDGRYALDINTTSAASDLLNASSGALSIVGGELTITDAGAGVLAVGQALPFITYGSFTGGTFTLAGTPLVDNGTEFTVGGNSFVLDYDHNGNQVALVAVPEPATVALLAMAGLGLLGRRRRSR